MKIREMEITETEISFGWNCCHVHRKVLKHQLPVKVVTKISSKWRHFCFNDHAGSTGPLSVRCKHIYFNGVISLPLITKQMKNDMTRNYTSTIHGINLLLKLVITYFCFKTAFRERRATILQIVIPRVTGNSIPRQIWRYVHTKRLQSVHQWV